MDNLIEAIRRHPAFAEVPDAGRLPMPRATRLPLAVALYREHRTPLVLITDRSDHALQLLDELALWTPNAPRFLFPEPTPLFYEQAPWSEIVRQERLRALAVLAAFAIPGAPRPDPPPIVVAPVRAVMTRTLPRRDFARQTRTLKRGQVVPLGELATRLVRLGYEPQSTVIAPGQFARRGGLLDLWPPAESHPIRLEFFGDEIDTLRRFDPASQRTIGTVERVLLTPAREFIPPAGDSTPYTEFDIPRLHPPASLLDYLPPNAQLIVDDFQALEDQTAEIETQAVELRHQAEAEGALPTDFPLPYLTWDDLRDGLETHGALILGPMGESGEHPLQQAFTLNSRYGGQIKPFMETLRDEVRQGHHAVVVSRQANRLRELWHEYAPLDEIGQVVFVKGTLNEGWTLICPARPPLHLYTDGEIFGWQRPQPRRRPRPAATAPEADYTDLHPGDWVVHVDHGVGRYVGLVRRTVDGVEREYLCIEYAEGDQLFVPVYQADRVTRYIGASDRPPTPTRLGTAEWGQVKQRVKEAVQQVAEDLLDLYARRQVAQGHAFGPDTEWQRDLESSFPYIETDDQLRAIQEVKRDMESPRPMDRLVCGDVGYGKTEVALRAAFKAVMDGKQVAILVPTTVLAQQHFRTFRQRLAAFPVVVEMLSRFRTPQQQDRILTRLASGAIDIIIGTHRLLSDDVTFKDLGLLIIDEEQRFGVTHKEKLKRLRTEVDVLTMTATPIPRTLYMALTGVRDISVINTPPEERLPVVTHVGPYDPKLVRKAILRELKRGGQVFFVHNRVQTIEAMRHHLERLVPEARIAVGHGQMPERELEAVMERFTKGEVDVLLSTSIIESGLDIPNANTLIVDRADTFGLAQLYQLRGRVGRGAMRAYAYFFRHHRKAPTPEGRLRLNVIAEHTQLGAGIAIAMRDLEMRGAGDLLGTRQHGHIAAVGFHLYTQLLAQAVRRLRAERGLPAPQSIADAPDLPTVSVDLPLAAGLPVAYVPDRPTRLGLYRRLANLRTLDEVDDIGAELEDRFGPLPEEVDNLLYQIRVKILAHQAGLQSVSVEGGQIVLRVASSQTSLPPMGEGVRAGKRAYWMPLSEDWQTRLLAVLQRLVRSSTV